MDRDNSQIIPCVDLNVVAWCEECRERFKARLALILAGKEESAYVAP